MRTVDTRLDREVFEEIATTSTYTEWELDTLGKYSSIDRDHNLLWNQISDIADKLGDDITTRQAFAVTDEDACIVGLQVLVRDHVHVISWLRSSDVHEYRKDDIRFLRNIGKRIRSMVRQDHKALRVHVFTSSLHEVVQ